MMHTLDALRLAATRQATFLIAGKTDVDGTIRSFMSEAAPYLGAPTDEPPEKPE